MNFNAEKMAKEYTKKYKVKYRAYYCPLCGNYHLTTKERIEQ